MNENSELHGTLALVRPDLENARLNQSGEIGVITYIDTQDEVFMSFRNGVEGRYSPDDLMQLKDRDQIFPELKNYGDLDTDDYKDLYKISLLQDMGRSTDILRALEIAGNNPAVWDKTLVPVSDRMTVRHELSFSR
jgi:hypothetical protein